MAAQSGFAANTTISDGWWYWKPDPSDLVSREVLIDTSKIQYIEATADHSKCWLYFAATSVSTSEKPYTLEDLAAQAFLTDMEALFP